MTFTKGIGSPAYMAPEILNQEYYKKSADIFSFAITMYEIFEWKEAYPKKDFKFPWNIAEFVVEGNRRPKPEIMSDSIFAIIEKTNLAFHLLRHLKPCQHTRNLYFVCLNLRQY